jgi:predicted amidohydrolase YtcJ
MLYENAVIWTGDLERPAGEALLVEDGVIRAVGLLDEVRAAAGAEVTRVDLGGAFVTPGLVDAHAHILSFGLSLERVDLAGAGSVEEAARRVAAAAADRRAGEGSGWILGRGWDQNDWPERRYPTSADLDRVCPDLPVMLSRIDGHAAWVNSKALGLAGVTKDTPDPAGGKILRDGSGAPTGILIDNAQDLVIRVRPRVEAAAKSRAIRRAMAALAARGLTGVHDMGLDPDDLPVYRGLADSAGLTVRVYGALNATPAIYEAGSTDGADALDVLARGPDQEWRAGVFKLGMVKFYMDGALGSRGAALLEPYSDDPGNRGLLLMDRETTERGLARALRAGFQCAVHAIGDRGNRTLLDAWERLRASGDTAFAGRSAPAAPRSGIGAVASVCPPIRLEHAQILAAEDIPRIAALGVIASMQPTHCTSDMPWVPERLGGGRLDGAYAWRSVLGAGAVLAAGSDFPIERPDPLLGLYAAITRRATNGAPPAGWNPEERLTREEALVAFTAAPAYASGDLHRRGTLTPGKDADFVVWDRDLVTCDPDGLLTARARLTVMGGRVTWRDPDASFGPALGEESR